MRKGKAKREEKKDELTDENRDVNRPKPPVRESNSQAAAIDGENSSRITRATPQTALKSSAAALPAVGARQDSLASLALSQSFIKDISKNSYGRFARSSSSQSFLIIANNPAGLPRHEVKQCNLISSFSPTQDRPLSRVEVIHNGLGEVLGVRAVTPSRQTEMIGDVERALSYELNDKGTVQTGWLMPTSPRGRTRRKKSVIPVFTHPLSEVDGVDKITKTVINGDDVFYRENKGKKRRCSQNKVMGNTSALNALHSFSDRKKSVLSKQAKVFLSRVKKAEWLHLLAHSLTPLTADPQQRSNLGAALARDNTRMMIIENIAKVLSRFKDVGIEVSARFSMLPATHIVRRIEYALELVYQTRRLLLHQCIDVFSYYDYPRASDQLLLLPALALLTGHPLSKVGVHSVVLPAVKKYSDQGAAKASAADCPLSDVKPTTMSSPQRSVGDSVVAHPSRLGYVQRSESNPKDQKENLTPLHNQMDEIENEKNGMGYAESNCALQSLSLLRGKRKSGAFFSVSKQAHQSLEDTNQFTKRSKK